MLHTRKALVLLAFTVACTNGPGPIEEELPEGVRVDVTEPIVLADDVVVVSDDPALVSVVLQDDGRLRFTYDAEPATPIAVGSVIVGDEEGGYMGRATEVDARSATEFDVAYEPVGLDEVIEEGAFFARISPNADEFVAASDEVGGRRSALGSYELVPSELLDGAATCDGLAEGSIAFRHDFQTQDITTELIFEKRGLFGIQRAGATATGGASVRLTLITEGHVNADCLLDVLELLRVEPIEWSRTMRLGPIPVGVTIRLRPELTTAANVNMEPTRVESTLFATASLRLGAIYERDRGIQPIAEFNRSVDFDMDLEDGGSVSGHANVHAGLYLGVLVSGLQLPSAGAELDAEVNISTDDLACTWAWDASVTGQAYLRGPVGIDLGFFSRTFTTLDESIGFSREANGGGDNALPYCEEDMCDAENPCIGEGEECVDGVCVEARCMEDTDCDAGMICDMGICVDDPSDLSTCDECTRAGHDWCGASGTCGAAGCSGDLRTSRSACVPCDYGSCTECAGDGFCSWDRASGTCVNDRTYDGDRTWLATNPGQCG